MIDLTIESRIIELLRAGPMRQTEIVDAFPFDMYLIVGKVVRDMDRRGLITREKAGRSYLVSLNGGTEHGEY